MKIDAHHHIWDLKIHPQIWMEGNSFDPIRNNFLMNDLREQLDETEIKKTILVQTVKNFDETPYLLDLASTDQMIAGVVGFLAMGSEDAMSHLDHYQSLPSGNKLVGIRDLAHDYSDPDFLSQPQVIKNCRELGKRGLVYDILTRTPQLRAGIELAKSCPEVTFVLDHISKPDIVQGITEPWREMMRELGSLPNVYCKVSGMITEADWVNWKTQDFIPYFDVVLESFGPSRLMYGSDWPVALLAGKYKDVITLAEDLTKSFSPSENQSFWSDAAVKAYSLQL